MSKHVGIPIKVLHDAEGHTVTVELKTGEVFRGKLDEAEALEREVLAAEREVLLRVRGTHSNTVHKRHHHHSA